MRYVLKLIALILIISSCQNEVNIEGAYVFKYGSYLTRDSCRSYYSRPIIINITADSFHIIDYEMDTSLRGVGSQSSGYMLSDSQMVVDSETDSDIYNLTYYFPDSIVLNSYSSKSHRNVLVPLKRYKQKSRKSQITKDFLQNAFRWSDSSQIVEFDTSRLYFYNDHFKHSIFNQTWEFREYDQELFLVMNNYVSHMTHLTDYSEGALCGISYQHKDKNVCLQPIRVKPNFNPDELEGGIWKEVLPDSRRNAPPPVIEIEEDYWPEEELTFLDDALVRRKYLEVDSAYWRPNHFNDKIIVHHYFNRIGNQWNVGFQSKDTLILHRYTGYSGDFREFSSKTRFERTWDSNLPRDSHQLNVHSKECTLTQFSGHVPF